MSEYLNKNEKKITMMKDLLIKMNKGLITLDKIKREFKEILSDITPAGVTEFWINMGESLST
jgi:DUF438 domain-containing protein